MSRNYSAGLVSRRFWFPEFKLYIQLRLEGNTDLEIKAKNQQENIFLAPSSNRQKEIFQGVKRRVNALDQPGIELFNKLDTDNQKILNLISVLMLDDLFIDFMKEVYAEKIRNRDKYLLPIDYRSFFTEKQKVSEKMGQWREYTLKRLMSIYHTYLIEAGLIVDNNNFDEITPKLLDRRLVQWLIDHNRKDIIIGLGGDLS
ncbi:DUF1819 family protein [Tetragenococcus muriaticus]|uniref:DUF1819 family protein n=1 Tax=Tetragenococcus muriaticus TaxID=64642 RepID=UPI0003FB9303|nr:DUF1819 family protein [Tetragenococcus muriaticus]GMA46059.1 hypothetical protein GCM10025854_03080 [Tetragenococcus muriaticus]GMA47345.1 hypothetical protein GCM10025854_15950 [Tetragenococcus muriaticus]